MRIPLSPHPKALMLRNHLYGQALPARNPGF
jgi:hypothetical protein